MVKIASNNQAKLGRIALILEKIYSLKYVPGFIKPLVKLLYFFLQDIRYYLFKGFNSMVPPPSYACIGFGNYEAIGNEFFNYFLNLGDLKPNHQILDVGCGSGRLALPLTNYLSEEGRYYGFDIIKSEIDWAQERISKRFQNFKFQHVDVNNNLYHKDAEIQAQNYKFPYNDESFDFIYLNSVFTHMLPQDIKNYIGEIKRVLKPDGKCLITFFLLNEESKKQIKSGKSLINFQYEVDGILTNNKDIAEDAIALEEEMVKNYFEQNDMEINEPIHYGSWSNRNKYLSFQDIVIVSKRNN